MGAIFGVSSPGHAEPSSPPATLNAGYPRAAFTHVDIKDAQAALEMWTRQLSKDSESPLKTKARIYPDENAIVRAINNKELDLVILSSPLYLKIKDQVPLDPVFVPAYDNLVGDEYLLLVHRDSGINSLKQLRGRRILIHPRFTPLSSEILWLNSLLSKQCNSYKRLFRSVKSVEKASQAILPVFFKKMDACLVMRRLFETVAELNPQIGKDLVAVAQSPPILRGIIAFRKDYSDKLKRKVSKTLDDMHTHPQGKQILTLLKYDKLVKFKPAYLRSVQPFYDCIKQAPKISQKR
jgi:phosphonate transport system substrate-binding protein